jgi:hypothetical protein
MHRDIGALNVEMVAAGVRIFAGGGLELSLIGRPTQRAIVPFGRRAAAAA